MKFIVLNSNLPRHPVIYLATLPPGRGLSVVKKTKKKRPKWNHFC